MYNHYQELSSGGVQEGNSMRKITTPISPQDEKDEINLTPMLDVVFIMLIFFIVTASFIKEAGIDVNRPDTQPESVIESENIIVDIDENSNIYIGRRHIDYRAVRANIERMHAENPQASVIIRANKRSFNDTLVQVMNASREAGVYDIAVAE